jgi:hypothetical protein
VCDGRHNVFSKDAKTGKCISVAGVGSLTEFSVVKFWRVDLMPPTTPGAAAPPQKGPNPEPVDNVFDRWKITGASDGGG